MDKSCTCTHSHLMSLLINILQSQFSLFDYKSKMGISHIPPNHSTHSSLSFPLSIYLSPFFQAYLVGLIMVSPDLNPQAAVKEGIEPESSPRISFSADTLEDSTDDFISINLLSNKVMKKKKEEVKMDMYPDFEFLSNDRSGGPDMITADELFSEGKLLPFWQMHHSEKLKKISLKTREAGEEVTAATAGVAAKEESNRVGNWFVDDDPSPRPPNCTVLWKELLRLKKKQRASTLSPSSSSSSSSSGSLDMSSVKEENAGNSKPARKGLERTKSATVSRIRPMVNVPICKTQGGRISSLPPLIPLRKARVDR